MSPEIRGSRECRAFGSPAASRAMKESTRVSHHRFAETFRHSLRNGFNGFLRGLPGDRAFLPPSPVRCASIVTELIPASRYQDATTSPSASAHSSVARAASTASSAQRSVTIAKRPSWRPEDARRCARDLPVVARMRACDISTRRANQIGAREKLSSSRSLCPGRGAAWNDATQIRDPCNGKMTATKPRAARYWQARGRTGRLLDCRRALRLPVHLGCLFKRIGELEKQGVAEGAADHVDAHRHADRRILIRL